MAYLLASGSLVLVFGRLGDLRGHRNVFLSGLLAFVGASLLCAAAPTISALVAFRALQGVAAAALSSVPLAILTATFPPAERGKAIGFFAASISVGLAVGPSLGGFLAATFGWRAAFLVNLPFGLAAWAFARRVLPDVPRRPGRLDLPGAATALGALASFLLFVNRAQLEGLSARTAPLLVAAILCGALFVRLERRAAEPMVALSIFGNRRVAFGASAAVLNFMAQYVVVFLTPFLLSRLLGAGPGRVGLVLTAFPLAVLCVAPFAGALSDRVGSALPAAAGALGSPPPRARFLATMPAGAGEGAVAWRLALFGVGTGLFQSPNNSAVMGSAPRPHLGVVGSLLGTSRTLGMVLGVAAAGAVLYAFVPASALRDGGLAPGAGRRLRRGRASRLRGGSRVRRGRRVPRVRGGRQEVRDAPRVVVEERAVPGARRGGARRSSTTAWRRTSIRRPTVDGVVEVAPRDVDLRAARRRARRRDAGRRPSAPAG